MTGGVWPGRSDADGITGTDVGAYADDLLKSAHAGETSLIELTPPQFRAFSY